MIIVYMMVIWFLILLFSDKQYFYCSIIILLSSVANILIVDTYELTKVMSYSEEVFLLIKLDGVTAMILTAFYFRDKLALKMSLLLAFSVLCHTMIIYDITVSSSFASYFFYTWYDELIAIVGLLQMVISRDGIISAFRNIQDHILRASFLPWYHSKSVSSHKRSGEGT